MDAIVVSTTYIGVTACNKPNNRLEERTPSTVLDDCLMSTFCKTPRKSNSSPRPATSPNVTAVTTANSGLKVPPSSW